MSRKIIEENSRRSSRSISTNNIQAPFNNTLNMPGHNLSTQQIPISPQSVNLNPSTRRIIVSSQQVNQNPSISQQYLPYVIQNSSSTSIRIPAPYLQKSLQKGKIMSQNKTFLENSQNLRSTTNPSCNNLNNLRSTTNPSCNNLNHLRITTNPWSNNLNNNLPPQNCQPPRIPPKKQNQLPPKPFSQAPINNELNKTAMNSFRASQKTFSNNSSVPQDDFIQKRFPKASAYFIKNQKPNQIEIDLLQVLERLLQNSQMFIDGANPKAKYGSYKKASQIFGNQQFSLFSPAQSAIKRGRQGIGRFIEGKDIIQGAAGDCYLMAALGSLAHHHPQLIVKNFLFKKNPADFYCVKLFFSGQWLYFLTDDQFPCMSDGTFAYCKNHGNQIWMMLLQKCWAKLFGSYQLIDGGTNSEGFLAITAMPLTNIYTSTLTKASQIKHILKQAYKNNHIVTAGCANKQLTDQKQYKQLGLIFCLGYSVLDILQIRGQTILKLRNTTYDTVWKGNWSFSSNKWTIKDRQELNYINDPKDGTFYMPIQQFKKYFFSIVICHVYPQYKFSALKFNCQQKKQIIISIKITTEGLYYFMLYHPDKRNQQAKYEYALISFQFTSFGQSPQPATINNHTTFKIVLRPGLYKMGLSMTWRPTPYPMVLKSYGPAQTELKKDLISEKPYDKR